jgi:hypothetical protein
MMDLLQRASFSGGQDRAHKTEKARRTNCARPFYG